MFHTCAQGVPLQLLVPYVAVSKLAVFINVINQLSSFACENMQ